MDEYLIVETQTETFAENVQEQIHAARIAELQALGYTIVTRVDGVKGIVPKNAATSLDDPEAQVTWLWDVPKESPDGTFYIQDIPAVPLVGAFEWDYTRREIPPEWADPATMEDMEFNAQFQTNQFE